MPVGLPASPDRVMGLVSLLGLDPTTYSSHALHQPDRTYGETNCYTDILIELLHAHGEQPLAAMGCTVRMDFEGDQWTFFKPFVEDLELLFGVDVHEMQPYRALPLQIAEQLVISPETVRTHVRNAMAKTGARTRAQLVAMALTDRHMTAGT